MLNIFFQGIDVPVGDIEPDVEKLFMQTKDQYDDIDKAFIKEIDKATYLDNTKFIDRFGVALYIENLSTGCKAAIAVHHNPGKIVSCLEVGYNALASIIKHCKSGNVILYPYNQYIEVEQDMPVDVMCRGHHFTSLNDISEYFYNDAPDEVDECED